MRPMYILKNRKSCIRKSVLESLFLVFFFFLVWVLSLPQQRKDAGLWPRNQWAKQRTQERQDSSRNRWTTSVESWDLRQEEWALSFCYTSPQPTAHNNNVVLDSTWLTPFRPKKKNLTDPINEWYFDKKKTWLTPLMIIEEQVYQSLYNALGVGGPNIPKSPIWLLFLGGSVAPWDKRDFLGVVTPICYPNDIDL